MKKLCLLPILCIGLIANAKTYYFSANGNDGNSGTSVNAPWKSISKLNSYFTSLNAGDSILFNRGDVFSGKINASKSGTSALPIVISAYGSGANPVISGFTTIASWTSLGGNIWESSTSVSSLAYTNMVVINGVNTAMGRTPNSGYYVYQYHTGDASITSANLSGNPNWTGAEVSAYSTTYSLIRGVIRSQSGNTITYTPGSSILWQTPEPYLVQKFIIQNDPRTLDSLNEWYYNPATKKLRIYNQVRPTNVQIATIDTLLCINSADFVVVDGIDFQGANGSAIVLFNASHPTIRNCNITFSGRNAINCLGGLSSYPKILNNTINYANNDGINFSNAINNDTIIGNYVKNVGMVPFNADMQGIVNQSGVAMAIVSVTPNGYIALNKVDSIGYSGIYVDGNNSSVTNNFVNHYGLLTKDGGGIYSWNGGLQTRSNITINNNIVLNASTDTLSSNGIYLDIGTNGINILNNTVYNAADGIAVNSWNVRVSGNNVYHCGYNSGGGGFYVHTGSIVHDITLRKNIFFAKIPQDLTSHFSSLAANGTIPQINSDSNYFAKPISPSRFIETDINGNYSELSLQQFQAQTNQDLHSISCAKTTTNINDLLFQYNASTNDTTISLDANYIDATGKTYNGSITLQPYTSATLIKNGALNIPPAANAGQDQTITLPVNSLTLSGSGTDADGTIKAYAWTKVSGPLSDSIFNANAVTTQISKLTAGIYLFALKVTDNNGASSLDTMKVIVNPAPNQLPVDNAGNDTTIYLPTNALTLYGSGNDPDGTIIKYLWTKISGPVTYTIQNPTAAITNITGLAQGVYQFKLTVTDNDSATGNDIVIVTVNPAPNKAPSAFAGSNQQITLPTNNVLLSGSGNDVDGTIVSYTWTKISGPAIFNISNSSNASTSVTNLVSGTYQFELDVTDNDGAIGKDVVQIKVDMPANIPPVANAGNDQSINLPVNSVSLSGNGNDIDGSIISYVWTKVSGPSSFNFSDSASQAPIVTNLAQGIYQFQLSVTDNNGAIATDVVEITVNNPTNISPTANAGSNQSISLPTDSVTLLGNGSDSDGNIISYKWIMLSGPSAVTIKNEASPATLVTGLVQGVYQFELAVIDNNSATGTSTVQVVVNAAVNEPPTVDAGTDQNITLPVDVISLAGNGNDTDGAVTNYRWTKISGPDNYIIENSDSAFTNVSGLIKGTYQFQLQVTDNNGATATDIMQVTVNDLSNIPPTADAGQNQNITLPVNLVTLSGTGNDSDGTVSSYLWTKISGPDDYSIANSTAATTGVSGLVEGVYQFELRVTDNSGATGTSIVQVTVNSLPNQPPVATAGADQSITLPQSSVTVSGSGTDPDGTIVSYFWSEISGPSSYTIINPTSAVAVINNLVQGIYNFEMQVTDNSGAVTTDTIQITVQASANILPLCSAGSDQTITLPENTVTLGGNASDADGAIVSYTWTKLSGPSTYTILNASSQSTSVISLTQGVYKFVLKVTDDKGGIARDTVVITVNAANNISPIATAGPDQSITLPDNSIVLSGSGSDPDGTITAYSWTVVSGPSVYTIINASSPVTNVTGLLQGLYQFQLAVTDNKGAVTTDVVEVIVNGAPNQSPTVSAGQDQTITLPLNSITATGSGIDSDGIIASYWWTKISGPSSYNILNPASAATNIGLLTQGTYRFMLKVTDNDGATATAVMKVTVKAAPNQPPVASAGPDKIITLPINSCALSGSGTDIDGNIVSYNWIKISGPSSYVIANASVANTSVGMLSEGIYQFQLKVKDNDGAIGTSNVQITVNKAPNKVPIVDAGADKSINLPTDSAIISGSGNDPDGTITGYVWTKVSGPSSYSFIDSSSSLMHVNKLVKGTYQFQLKVTDNDGAIATDIVEITVNAAPNQAPIAYAGQDQTITLPANIVTLKGNGTDNDGTIVSYSWSKISGPSSYSIADASLPNTKINNLIPGTYQFQLKVTDNDGATSTDILQVVVKPAPNQSPISKAGVDQSITLPINSVTLSGNGTDADGTISVYSWTKISGPSNYSFQNASATSTAVNGLIEGVYQFQLSVTDNDGATSTDVVQITVNAAPNQTPVANAGTDQSVTLPMNTVSLKGSGLDADGSIVSYLWTKISGPSSYAIINASSASANINGLVTGVYQFELKVTDNVGATGTDIIQIIVNPAVNLPPVANAWPNQTIKLPSNSITVYGSGTDKDGVIVNYSWSKVSGPSNFNIVDAASSTTIINGLTTGIYQFELRVTDNNGASGKDTITIIVNPSSNIPPIVNAGSDQTLFLPVNSATLTGTADDADGSIKSYLWAQISGPTTCGIVNAASPVTDVWNLNAGSYSFELSVTDNQGIVIKDTTQIIIIAKEVPPTANAGADQTVTLPQNSVEVKGAGTSLNGVITSYLWVQISGPSSAVIAAVDSSNTSIESLTAGNYQFQLTVSDNYGHIGKDTIIISVAEPRLNVSNQSDLIKVFPNPVVNNTLLQLESNQPNISYNIIIISVEGNVVYKNVIVSNSQNVSTQQINLSNLAKGIYTLNLYQNNKMLKSIPIVKL